MRVVLQRNVVQARIMVSTKEADFMDIVREYPCLYDKGSEEFKRRDIKTEAWKDVKQRTGIENPEAQYKTIRDRFTRYLRTIKLPSGSGSIGVISKGYESLRWMQAFIKHRRTISNDEVQLDLEEQVTETETSSHHGDDTVDEVDALDLLHTIDSQEEDIVNDDNNNLYDILDVSTAPSTSSIQDTQVVNRRSSAPAEHLKRKASVEPPKNSDSRQETQKKSYNKNQKLEADDELWKSAIRKLSKNAPAEDDCFLFGSMVAEKLRAIPQRKRSLAQIRLLQVFVELDDELM